MQYRGVFNTVGDIMINGGGGGGYLEYRGRYHDKCGVYLEYRGGTQYHGDTMMHVGDIMS